MNHKYRMLGIPVSSGERSELYARAAALIGKGGVINTVNPEMMKCAVEDPELYSALSESLNIPDGNILAAAMRSDGEMTDVYPGVELGEDLLEERGVRLAIIGGREGIAEQALERLCEKHREISPAFAQEGYSIDERILDGKINAHKPTVVFLCLGTPRQQLLARSLHSRHPGALFLSLGGSVDVYAGRVKRAPRLWRRAGLEWLYRVLREPARIPRLIRSFAFFRYRRMQKHGKLHKYLLKSSKNSNICEKI